MQRSLLLFIACASAAALPQLVFRDAAGTGTDCVMQSDGTKIQTACELQSGGIDVRATLLELQQNMTAMQATVETLVSDFDTFKQNASSAPYKRGGLYGTCSYKSDNWCIGHTYPAQSNQVMSSSGTKARSCTCTCADGLVAVMTSKTRMLPPNPDSAWIENYACQKQ